MDVSIYRQQNPDCSYCKYNKMYNIIGRVPECSARQMCCWNYKKIAKKCPLYEPMKWEI